jgi:predicted amidohydrolase YtcJ
MFTINAARELGEEKRLGTLEAGKLADFIVIDRNPFKIPVTDIHNVITEQVYLGGTLVFERKTN